MSTLLTTTTAAEIVEQVITAGDLARLTPQQRVNYYRHVCDSLGLNPLTRPFEYITLNNKLTLYARKDATDQIRKRYGVSIIRVERETTDGGVYVVTAYAAMPDGRQDSDIGAVSVKGLSGDALANAYMKASTKAKRRVTLSICGLGMLDETEVETISDAQPVAVDTATGEIVGSQSGKPNIKARWQGQSDAPGPAADFNSGPTMLAYINTQVEVPFDNVYHLQQAIRAETSNPRWSWPRPGDAAAWQDAYTVAKRHADAKLRQAESEMIDDAEANFADSEPAAAPVF